MIDILPGIQSTSSALNAERIRGDVIAQNIANSTTTRDAAGHIYQRQEVLFESLVPQAGADGGAAGQNGAQVSVRIAADSRPPRLSPDPSNPGKMIETPDINIHREMTDLIISQRAYEANLAVAKSAKSMALQTLAIGKRG